MLCNFTANICYLTGFETIDHFGPILLLVPAEGDPTLLVSDFEAYNVLVGAWLEDVVIFKKFGDPVPTFVEFLTQRGWAQKRLGWEHARWGMSYLHYTRVKDLVHARWSYERGTVEKVMARKSAEEMAVLRTAGKLTAAGMQAAFDTIAEGIPEAFLARISPTPLLLVVAAGDTLTPTDLAVQAYL